jgi:kinesin family protein 2/24
VQLTNASEPEVTFTGELLQLIEQTAALRKTASTEKNNGSSRSHAVCRLRIANPSADVVEDGYLYLIDLAGSEAARDIAEHGADRMKETREINIILSTLKDCIRSITDVNSSRSSKEPYVPFRQSTLTKTLKNVFDLSGNRKCKTVVLVCVNPSFLDTIATKNTLRYAEMLLAAPPTNKSPTYNPNVPMTWTNKDVRDYITTKVFVSPLQRRIGMLIDRALARTRLAIPP